MPTNKSLGQHWLTDRVILSDIAEAAEIMSDETVLEIGPGLGTLTSELLKRAKKVVAVEFDQALAEKLPGQFPGKNLIVMHEDILSFDLDSLPKDYVVVANVPYYITSKIVQKLMTADNKPRITVLLVQKEVAERIAAGPGDMSVLGIAAQVYAKAELDIEVPRNFFTPPPKVDSQVVVLRTRQQPFISNSEEKELFRLVKAAFVEKRKKLRSSLAGGFRLDKELVEAKLEAVGIPLDARPQELSIEDWKRLYDVWQ